jgi:hypothetical protein
MGVKISENFLKIYFTNGMCGNNVVSDCHHHCSCPCIPKATIITDMFIARGFILDNKTY